MKETRKSYIEWWVVGAQVVKVRESLHVAPRTRKRHTEAASQTVHTRPESAVRWEDNILFQEGASISLSRGRAAVKSEIFPVVHRTFGHT